MNINLYTSEETRERLLTGNYYKEFLGRGKNRTLKKKDPKLFHSIYKHTEVLQTAFKSQNTTRFPHYYNFAKRIQFIVDHNYQLEQLRCKCGKRYNWTPYCRYCSPKDINVGKPRSEETKQKLRISTLKYLEKTKGQVMPRYNVNSIAVIEKIGKELGYTFQHAENGGEYFIKEAGYFVDGYDPVNNIVLEIDEKHHYVNHTKLREKDLIRQKRIEEVLNCTFIRVKI